MKIEINLKIIFVVILFFLINNLNTYIVFLISVLIHEIAHMIVGILLGGIPNKMAISPLGVSLEFYSYVKAKTLYKIIFFSIGPLSNLLIAWIIAKFLAINELNIKIVLTNIAIGLFNLVPILPLDGGKIMKEILKSIIGFEKANKYMIYFSKCFLILISFAYSILIIKIKNIIILFLLIYLWYLYCIEEKKYYIYEKANSCIKNMI